MAHLLLPTSYFPPVSYLAVMTVAEGVTIEHLETYPKQTIRNHCRICGPNGLQALTVPVKKPHGNHTLTRDIRVDDSLSWQRIHWRTITAAYSKSPYFLFYQDELQIFFEQRFETLAELNREILGKFLSILNITIPVTFTENYEKIPAGRTDLRAKLSSKDPLPVQFPRYPQVFEPKHGFLGNLSCLDLLFNLGPGSYTYLRSCDLSLFLK